MPRKASASSAEEAPSGGASSAHSGERIAVFPPRFIGEIGPEKPVDYPKFEEWPKYIQDAIKRRGNKPIRLYADGVFDLCHFGHLRALEQAKKSFPNTYLMVGCCNDAVTHKFKGQTVMTEAERYESLRHCKWVDEVIPDAPWVIDKAFLDKHDIDFVCHDALPYVDTSGTSACGDVYQPLRDIGRFHATQRTEGVSTTDLINRIISGYDDYVRRNLSRGVSAAEMNIPPLRSGALALEMGIEKGLKAASAQIHKVSEAAEHAQHGFLRLFSQQGPLVSFVSSFVRPSASSASSEGGAGSGSAAAASASASGGAGAAAAAEAEAEEKEAGTPSRKRRRTEASDASPAKGSK